MVKNRSRPAAHRLEFPPGKSKRLSGTIKKQPGRFLAAPQHYGRPNCFFDSIRLPDVSFFSMVRSWVQTLGKSRREDARTLEKPVSNKFSSTRGHLGPRWIEINFNMHAKMETTQLVI